MLPARSQISLPTAFSLKNSIWYNGHRFCILKDGEQTDGAFTLIHCFMRRGGEPPAHYHQNEDMTSYVLQGEIRYHIGSKIFNTREGELAYLPKGIPHQFKLITQTAKVLMLITPAGFESFFRQFSVPAKSMGLPPVPDGEPPAVFINQMLAKAEELGIVWMPEF
ncbi:MAG: cupin domain-containing protein [Candidatus Dadabacteria bacterium]